MVMGWAKDLGDLPGSPELARPTLGDSEEFPFSRRMIKLNAMFGGLKAM